MVAVQDMETKVETPLEPAGVELEVVVVQELQGRMVKEMANHLEK
jgi:hypothetical protein